MKTRICVMNPNRLMTIKVVRSKRIKQGQNQKTVEVEGQIYVIDPDKYMLTYARPWKLWKTWYTTLYYAYGKPQPLPAPGFEDMPNLGVQSGELQALFTPFFYKVIAPPPVALKERIMFLLLVACTLGIGYIIFLLSKANEAGVA